MARWRKVVEKVENHFTEINEVDARKINPEVTLEGFVEENYHRWTLVELLRRRLNKLLCKKYRS